MGLLNWNSSQHYDHSGDCACTQCGKPTPLRAHSGEPVHKVCAETWNDNNPQAPRVTHKKHDLGTTRFHSDTPRESRKKRD
ncbi:hypothetical protein AB0G79_02830 [Streptomyces sp. NPDC020807]|uniref:hypothetical protein n=1 Tax=Streptomyces sp. NPDC020807 TaxID=3155119 RepID=UPI0033C658B8